MDIWEGRFLREHHDVDALTEDLHTLFPVFEQVFSRAGYDTREVENGDLKIASTEVKLHIGHVICSGKKAEWTHNGAKGSLVFPQRWLDTSPYQFYSCEVMTVAPEFEYVIKISRIDESCVDASCERLDSEEEAFRASCTTAHRTEWFSPSHAGSVFSTGGLMPRLPVRRQRVFAVPGFFQGAPARGGLAGGSPTTGSSHASHRVIVAWRVVISPLSRNPLDMSSHSMR